MTSPAKRCKECGSEANVATLGAFSGEEGAVTVQVDGMPAMTCAKDHKRFLYPEFVALLMDFVADPGKIAPQPPAVRRGLIKKHYHCSGCDAELPAAPGSKSERALDAAFRNAASFKVVVRVALYKCERCGREQVRSNEELADSAFKAISHGFRSADIHPDR
jgi:DNA-directed RNA polymerase subunit RPC12/RpoP